LDLGVVGVLARLDMKHRHVEAGAGAAGHVDRQVERPDVWPHRLVAQSKCVERVRQDRRGNSVAADAPGNVVRHVLAVSYRCLAMIWSLFLAEPSLPYGRRPPEAEAPAAGAGGA